MFAEEKKNLFPKSLTGTTIQDGSTRKRRDNKEKLWYYKENNNINSLRLITKKGELCPYLFKYNNCKDNY